MSRFARYGNVGETGMYGNEAVDWTVGAIETLKTKWAAGWSHSQIAALIPNATRSAIAGKIMRLKLPARATGHGTSGAKQYTASPRPAPRPKPGKTASLSQVPTTSPRRNPNNSLAAKLAIAEAEPGLSERLHGEKPDGTGKKFIDLAVGECKWPKGDPLDADFEFCGCKALPDLPYCAPHTRRAIQPTQQRNRADRALAGI